jgi:hypothetical protein
MRGRENFEERRAEVHRRFDPILQSGDNTRQEKIDIQNQMHEELRKISEDEDRATDSRLFSKACPEVTRVTDDDTGGGIRLD